MGMVDIYRRSQAAREVIQLAGVPEDALYLTGTEGQRWAAYEILCDFVKQRWETVKAEYKTPKMAKAIIAACQHHPEAVWWIKNQTQSAYYEIFRKEVSDEYKKAS